MNVCIQFKLPNSLISSVNTPGSLSIKHQFPALSAIAYFYFAKKASNHNKLEMRSYLTSKNYQSRQSGKQALPISYSNCTILCNILFGKIQQTYPVTERRSPRNSHKKTPAFKIHSFRSYKLLEIDHILPWNSK